MELTKPTKEQQKILWEWCGFKLVNGIVWIDESDNRIHKESPIDLNNLFKYAVPKVVYIRGGGHPCTVSILIGSGTELVGEYRAEISNSTLYKTPEYTTPRYSIAFDKDPTLALFWAIWEVIHGTN